MLKDADLHRMEWYSHPLLQPSPAPWKPPSTRRCCPPRHTGEWTGKGPEAHMNGISTRRTSLPTTGQGNPCEERQDKSNWSEPPQWWETHAERVRDGPSGIVKGAFTPAAMERRKALPFNYSLRTIGWDGVLDLLGTVTWMGKQTPTHTVYKLWMGNGNNESTETQSYQ